MADKGCFEEMISWTKRLQKTAPEICAFSVTLLEKHAKEVARSNDIENILFLWEQARRTETRQSLMEGMLGNGNDNHALMLLNLLEQKKHFGWIAHFASNAFEGFPESRDFSILQLQSHLDELVEANHFKALAALLKKSGIYETRRRILAGLMESGKHDSVRSLMDGLAAEGKWNEIMNWTLGLFGNEPGLREHSISLLEKNVSAIIRSGSENVVRFLSANSRSESTLRALGRMPDNRRHAARQSEKDHTEIPKAAGVDGKRAGKAGRMEKLFAAWQDANQDDEKRYLIMSVVMKKGSSQDVKDFLDLVAGEMQWGWVKRFSRFLYDRPDLQSYANSLIGSGKSAAAAKSEKISGAYQQKPGFIETILSDIRNLGSIFQP